MRSKRIPEDSLMPTLLALTQPAPFLLCADMPSVLDTAPKSLLPTPGDVRYVEAYSPSMNWIIKLGPEKQGSGSDRSVEIG